MGKFEVGKVYKSEPNVLFENDTKYTCVKRNAKSVLIKDDFYNEVRRFKIQADGDQEYITISGDYICPLEIRA